MEDDEQVRAVVQEMLEGRDYAVVPARDGSEAVSIAAQADVHVDLLLTDLVMPGLGGRQLAERVTTLQPEARVLFMSGYTEDTVLRQGIVAHDVAFIEKPFGADELASRVGALLTSAAAPQRA